MKKVQFLCVILMMGIMLFDGKTAYFGAMQGIELCIKTVIPSLFPFIFLSAVLNSAGGVGELCFVRSFSKWFRLPRGADGVLIPAFLGGYPVGAQCVAIIYRSGKLSKDIAERMLSFCSNIGPSFLFGIISAKFTKKEMIWVVWGIQIVSAWTAARLCMHSAQKEASPVITPNNKSDPMNTAVSAIWKISGWVVMFRIALVYLDKMVLKRLSTVMQIVITGILELTNACCFLDRIADERVRVVVCSGLIAFGGMCVFFQTCSVCDGMRMKYYVLGKLIQSVTAIVLSATMVWGIWYVIPLWFLGVHLAGRSKKLSSIPVYVGV